MQRIHRSTRLHIRTSSPRDRNHGVDPVHHLPMGQFVHIAIVVSQSEISVRGYPIGDCSRPSVHRFEQFTWINSSVSAATRV